MRDACAWAVRARGSSLYHETRSNWIQTRISFGERVQLQQFLLRAWPSAPCCRPKTSSSQPPHLGARRDAAKVSRRALGAAAAASFVGPEIAAAALTSGAALPLSSVEAASRRRTPSMEGPSWALSTRGRRFCSSTARAARSRTEGGAAIPREASRNPSGSRAG